MPPEARAAVVVSGASSGVGRQTAVQLVRRGYAVVAVARRTDRLETLAEEHSGRIFPMSADVRDLAALTRGFDELPTEFRDIRAIVNNAGLSKGFGPIQAGDPPSWQEMVDTNIVGLLNVTRTLLPSLLARGEGHIVNIGSIAASYPYTGGNVYAATKAFVHQLTLNMRADLEGTGVRVTCVAPGMIRTEVALTRYNGDHRRANELYDGVVPLTAEDVADAVVWCLSRPLHVNVNMVEIMPTDQPFSLRLGNTRGAAGRVAGSEAGGQPARGNENRAGHG